MLIRLCGETTAVAHTAKLVMYRRVLQFFNSIAKGTSPVFIICVMVGINVREFATIRTRERRLISMLESPRAQLTIPRCVGSHVVGTTCGERCLMDDTLGADNDSGSDFDLDAEDTIEAQAAAQMGRPQVSIRIDESNLQTNYISGFRPSMGPEEPAWAPKSWSWTLA